MLLLQVWMTHLLAALSPGPDVLLTLRNSLAFGRHDGILTASGIVVGVSLQISLCLLGLVWALQRHSILFHGVALLGGIYLVYLGYGALRSSFQQNHGGFDLAHAHGVEIDSEASATFVSRPWATPFREGLLTNLLNPKALLYFFAVFTLVLTHEVTPWQRLSAGVGMVIIQFIAFTLFALLVTHPAIRSRLSSIQNWLLRGMSLLFVGLGLRLGMEHLPALIESFPKGSSILP